MKPSILVTRALFPEHLEWLGRHFEVESNQQDVSFDAPELKRRLIGKQGVVVAGGDRIDASILASTDTLKAVATVSVGYNHIDVAACSARGVMVTNTPDVLTETTADLAWSLMMSAARRVPESERWLRAGHWKRWAFDQFLGVDIHHSTLGIFGMGRIGQAIARRASGFSMRVMYHNRSHLPPDVERECRAEYVSREDLLRESDHIILVVPYSPESHHMIGADELAMMKPTATLTNIARGGLIDEPALVEALRSGRLAAAGLDVFEGEPRILPALLELDNVALAPHIGSASRPTRDAMARLAIGNLIDALEGRRPPCLLNTEMWKEAN